MRYDSKPPEVEALLGALTNAQVKFVVVGSVAVRLRGGAIEPGDLDIVPDLAPNNLACLASVLADLDATVANVDCVGAWERTTDGEWKWRQRQATASEREVLMSWRPKPDEPSTFDQLLHTRLGNLDIVPVIAGEFSALCSRATAIQHHGSTALVAHVDDLLATLTVPRRSKDAERVRFLRGLQRGGRAR